jgi:hypothetical protein
MWSQLLERHEGGPPIQLLLDSRGFVDFRPKICEACQAKQTEDIANKKKIFIDKTIHVKLLQSDEVVPTNEFAVAQKGQRNVRRSSRKKKSPKDSCFDMLVNSHDTIGMLKLKILEKKVHIRRIPNLSSDFLAWLDLTCLTFPTLMHP